MQNRSTLYNTNRNKKISTPTKPTLTPGNSEGYHKRCTQLPSALVKPRPPSVKHKTSTPSTALNSKERKLLDKTVSQHKPTLSPLYSSQRKDLNQSPSVPTSGEKHQPSLVKPIALTKSTRSTVSTNSTKSIESKKESQPQPTQQKPALPLVLEASLEREDLKPLVAKFSEVTSSILQVATSQTPVSTRSLEALINRELTNCLGEDVNNSKFAQGFVQATRRLLEKLVSLYEGGKLNPKLFKDRSRENKSKSYIKADPATTVCYRDRYFKELVMNVLQSMTTSELEEEVMCRAACGMESEERIRIIREMVRTEARLEPEEFRELDQRLEELRRAFSRNKQEVEKATKEVEGIISQHSVEQESLHLVIPKPAREIWRTRLESGCEFDENEAGACKSGKSCSKTSCSRRNVENGFEKYKKSLSILGNEECFEQGNSDEVKNIRPQLKNVIHKELLRIKMKEGEISNHDREFDRNIGLGESPQSSFESVEFKSATSNFSDKEEDGISEEETTSFLKALKAEIEERKITDGDVLTFGYQGVSIKVLPRIDEREDEEAFRETLDRHTTDYSQSSKSENFSSSTLGVEKGEAFEIVREVNLNINKQLSIHNVIKQESDEILIERVKSKLLDRETSEVTEVIAEMRDAFEMFKAMSDVFSACKISEDSQQELGDAGSAILKNENDLWDFTVGEVANVLVNISVKISNLPDYLREIGSNQSSMQKEQAYNVLSVLERLMNFPNPIDQDVEMALEEAFASLPIKKFALTFSFLSDTLNSSPKDMRSKSISVLNPPKSLIETLYALSSTTYFRDCFVNVKSRTFEQDKTKHVEVVKPYDMNEQRSSKDFNPIHLGDFGGCKKKIYTHTRDTKRPEDINKNLEEFENFRGLSASVMTVQNVSDMFLFLSTVLNDVPDRLKSEKIFSLDPPLSLLNALNILYHEDENQSVSDIVRKKSFASLTLQNVSDFLLTLSRTFYDIPERLKDSIVADMSPPPSLLRAINLLTSHSHFSIPENLNEAEEDIDEGINRSEQETFFDAVASITSLS